MYMITRGMGGWAGGILYQSGEYYLFRLITARSYSISDFSRYAKHPGDQMWGQIFIIPICLFGSNLLGIITTSCARGLYPDEPLLWKFYDLLETIQKHGGGGTRAAVFFAASAFLLSQLCVNVVACGVVGGMDLAALLPRLVLFRRLSWACSPTNAPSYITIRRGSFVIAIIGFAINPWRILNVCIF
jgi:NCS1 family nucleobase:cation symporter-1